MQRFSRFQIQRQVPGPGQGPTMDRTSRTTAPRVCINFSKYILFIFLFILTIYFWVKFVISFRILDWKFLPEFPWTEIAIWGVVLVILLCLSFKSLVTSLVLFAFIMRWKFLKEELPSVIRICLGIFYIKRRYFSLILSLVFIWVHCLFIYYTLKCQKKFYFSTVIVDFK